MAASLVETYRRLRHGRPIVVVSGLPRSGTSMMMKMLAAGGVEPVTDSRREPDESNPEGYFELERVKTLEHGDRHPWLADCRGRALKVVSFLLPHLPDVFNYRVLLMDRALHEVVASQDRMLERAGETPSADLEALAARFREHLAAVRRLLDRDACFEWLEVSYNRVVADPEHEAERVSRFLGGRLRADRMAAAVNPSLYRSRQRM